MKRLVFIILATGFITTAHAITWQKTYGGDKGKCVQETSDGNYLVAGNTTELDPWLFKTDTLGNIIWEQIDKGGSNWVEETSDNGLILAGVPDLLKADSEGDSLWAKDFGIYSMCVQEIPTGGYILLGTAIGEDEGIILIRTDENGDSIWSQTYEESGNNINSASFVHVTNDRGYIIVGTTGYEDEEYNRWSQLWLIKTDSAGDNIWDQKYGEQEWNSSNYGYCVRQTSDGGYIIAGEKGSGGFWLIKTDDVGDTIWTKTYGGEYCNSVLENSEGNYIAVGTGSQASPWFSIPGDLDILLVKIDADGNTIWGRHHGSNDGGVGRCVSQTSDDGFIVTGRCISIDPGGLYLLKTDSLGLLNSIEEEPLPETKHWTIASVISTQVVLRFWDCSQGFQGRVFDVSGREVDIIETSASVGTLTWGKSFPSGVYFIQVSENKKTSAAKVVLVK